MKNFIDYEKLQKLSEADKDAPLYKKIIKLQEECGEGAQGTIEAVIEAVIEEVCDAPNICIDILNFIEMKYPELSVYIAKRFQEKLDKWEFKIESNKFMEEYKLASDEQNEKVVAKIMNDIIQEDMNDINFN